MCVIHYLKQRFSSNRQYEVWWLASSPLSSVEGRCQTASLCKCIIPGKASLSSLWWWIQGVRLMMMEHGPHHMHILIATWHYIIVKLFHASPWKTDNNMSVKIGSVYGSCKLKQTTSMLYLQYPRPGHSQESLRKITTNSSPSIVHTKISKSNIHLP